MTRFSTRNVSRAQVPAPRAAIWDALTDPACLTELTPLLNEIVVDGDQWTWQLTGIRGLGLEVAPSFTVQMDFEPQERITYRPVEPTSKDERAAAAGVYELTDLGNDHTRLFIDITLHVDLPLPALSRRAVEKVMSASMQRTGRIFGERLYDHLGIDPALAGATETLVAA